MIAPLIAPVVGPSAPALGRVLADLGLRTLLQAEVGSSEPDEAANRAVATTVEEVVRHVALARCHAGG